MALRRDPYAPHISGSKSPQATRARRSLGLPRLKGAAPAPADPDLGNARIKCAPCSQRTFLLTTPEMRHARVVTAQARHEARGGKSKLQLAPAPETAADRFLTPESHDALCWYLRIAIAFGGAETLRGSGAPLAIEVPPAERALWAGVYEALSRRMHDFLYWLALHEYAKTPPDRGYLDTGRRLIDCADGRRAVGGLDGYILNAADTVAFWRQHLTLKA